MNEQEATRKAEQIIQETASALNPKPRLEVFSRGTGSGPCVDPTDGGSEERIQVHRIYWLRDIPKEQNIAIAQQVLDLWKRQGWKIRGVHGFDRNDPMVNAWTRPDEFGVALQTNSQGELSLVATSPCIWPKGKPE